MIKFRGLGIFPYFEAFRQSGFQLGLGLVISGLGLGAPCGLRGCKNGPAPFPGRMSYKATKPGLVYHILACCIIVLWFIKAPFMYC